MVEKVDEQVEDTFGTDVDPLKYEDSANSDLAEETLADADETSKESAEKPEDRPSVADHAKLREQRREARDEATAAKIEAAELRGKMAGMQERQVVEAELSPVQVRMKEQGITDEADLDLTTGETMKLMRQEHKWENAQSAKTTAATTETERQDVLLAQQAVANEKDHGDGLDYGTIVDMGEKFLTDGEKLDIRDNKEPYDLAYSLCLRAIQERGDESTKKVLQENLARKTKETVEDDPKKPDKPNEDETNDEEIEPISNPRLAALAADAVGGGTNA